MIINIKRSVAFSLSFCFATLSLAHSGHVHKAPLVACDSLNRGELCSYTVGKNKVYKGTCQRFEKTLMCVRNQPIEYLNPLNNSKLENIQSKTLQKP
ncbi:hypothetical protein D1814_15490 [Alteromonas sp. BL110]|nr:hypothetical protein D1814_15490 [Alteromonas sp. BL110]RKM79211.1 hypothetical protein D7031_09485 [Alteromonas sp. BL110]